MAFTKREKVVELLVFLFLVLFPFGRLFSFEIQILDFRISFVFLDFIAFFAFLFCLSLDVKIFLKDKIFLFLLPFIFSFFVSWGIFRLPDILVGTFYFFRIVFYLSFGLMIDWFIQQNEARKHILFQSLIFSILAFLVFGFWQYIFYYDLRPLKELGWDDHLWRLTSTLFDPGFTGIVLSFGFIFSFINFFFIKKGKFWLVVSFFFLLGVGLTFSRASYVSLIFGSLYLFYKINIKFAGALIVFFAFLVFILPKPEGEGVNLLRTYSIFDRIGNYRESFVIFSKSPLFGVGYNNLCLARKTFLGDRNLISHSCSGTDSSLFFVLATMGVIGFLFFIDLLVFIWRRLGDNYQSVSFKTSLIMILIHSQFNNSIFYPWVLAVFAFLFPFALSAKTEQ